MINTKSMHVIFAFGFSRALLFLSPLLIANLLPALLYGQVEAGLAAGAILSVIALLGVPALLPLSKIQGRKDVSTGVSWMLALSVCVAGIVTSVCFLIFEAYEVAFVCAVAAALSIQAMWSSESKSGGYVAKGLLYDSVLMVSLVVGVVVVSLSAGRGVSDSGLALLACAAVIASVLLVSRALLVGVHRKPIFSVRATLVVGASVMLTNVSSVVLMSSGRLGAFFFLGSEEAGRYAALYRVSILPVAIYQLASNLIFRNLYSGSNDEFDKRTATLLVLVLLVCAVVDVFSSRLGFVFGPAFLGSIESNGLAFSVLVFQVVLWCAVSQFEILISRLKLNALWLKGFLFLVIVIFFISFFPVFDVNTVLVFCFVHLALVLSYLFMQVLVLSSRGFSYWRSSGVVVLSMCCLAASLILR